MSEITVYEDDDDGFGRPGANDRLLHSDPVDRHQQMGGPRRHAAA